MREAMDVKWAGEVSALGFIVENMVAMHLQHYGSVAVRDLGDEMLRQWSDAPHASPEGMTPIEAAAVHQAGRERLETLWAAVVDRIEQTER